MSANEAKFYELLVDASCFDEEVYFFYSFSLEKVVQEYKKISHLYPQKLDKGIKDKKEDWWNSLSVSITKTPIDVAVVAETVGKCYEEMKQLIEGITTDEFVISAGQ